MGSGSKVVSGQVTGGRLLGAGHERMSIHNLRLKLIKVAAVVIRNTRRIRLMISEHYPWKDELSQLVGRLVPT